MCIHVPMYIEIVPNRGSRPAVLLREGRREGKRVVKRTLANLSAWPVEQIEALRAVLKGATQVGNVEDAFEITRTRPHGHVAAVLGTLRKLKHMQNVIKNEGLSTQSMNDNIEDFEEVPAYVRKKIAIHNANKAAGSKVSKFTLSLDEDNQPIIRENNAYLNDNVD